MPPAYSRMDVWTTPSVGVLSSMTAFLVGK
jgi:hypothetical protein